MCLPCVWARVQAQALCRAQTGRGSSGYPWAVVANNITLMLADVMELRADQFAGSRKAYWGVFETREAYFEVRHVLHMQTAIRHALVCCTVSRMTRRR